MRLRRDSWAMKTALAGFSAITSGQALATFYCQGQFRDAHTGATVDLFAMCSTFSYTDPEANTANECSCVIHNGGLVGVNCETWDSTQNQSSEDTEATVLPTSTGWSISWCGWY
mgnify:CR=1 FL=1